MEGLDINTTDEHKEDAITEYAALPEIEAIKLISEVYTPDFLFAGAARGGLWLRNFQDINNVVMGKQDVNVTEAMNGLENVEMVQVSSLHVNSDGSYAVDIPGIMTARDAIRYVQIEDLGGRTLKVNEVMRAYSGVAAEMDVNFNVGDKRYQEEHKRAHIPVEELDWSRATAMDTNDTSLDDFIANYNTQEKGFAHGDNSAYFTANGKMEAYNSKKGANLSESAGIYYKETHDGVEYLLTELPGIPAISHGSVRFGQYSIYKYDEAQAKVVSLSYKNFAYWGGCGIKKFNLSALESVMDTIRANDPDFQ